MFSFVEDHLIFKREVVSPDGPVFTDVEQKLLTLGLNSAAHQGEVDNAAVMLVRSWRQRGVSAEQVVAAFAQRTFALRQLEAARGYLVNFGKYKGRSVGELPPNYIRWALEECDNLSFNLRRAMEIVLNQGLRK
jgi:uncharacterized protein (DUF3820 family)